MIRAADTTQSQRANEKMRRTTVLRDRDFLQAALRSTVGNVKTRVLSSDRRQPYRPTPHGDGILAVICVKLRGRIFSFTF